MIQECRPVGNGRIRCLSRSGSGTPSSLCAAWFEHRVSSPDGGESSCPGYSTLHDCTIMGLLVFQPTDGGPAHKSLHHPQISSGAVRHLRGKVYANCFSACSRFLNRRRDRTAAPPLQADSAVAMAQRNSAVSYTAPHLAMRAQHRRPLPRPHVIRTHAACDGGRKKKSPDITTISQKLLIIICLFKCTVQ